MVLAEIIYLQEFKRSDFKMKRFAHYDLHKVEIVGLDEENNYSYVKVFDATGLVFFKEYHYVIGLAIIDSGEDFFEMEVDE